jgi:hypothetical protein
MIFLENWLLESSESTSWNGQLTLEKVKEDIKSTISIIIKLRDLVHANTDQELHQMLSQAENRLKDLYTKRDNLSWEKS